MAIFQGVRPSRPRAETTEIRWQKPIPDRWRIRHPPIRAIWRAAAANRGVRLYNERLVLSLIRRYGSLPKAEIARVTGLSAQTASVIVKQLEADGLLLRQRPQRGRIGQPPVPLSLNPDGAYSIGLKVGRRSADLVLIDLMGKVRASRHRTYRYPEPAAHARLRARRGSRNCSATSSRRSARASPASASRRRSSCGTGRRRSARRATCCRSGARSTWRARWRSCRAGRCSSATTRPRPARPSSPSASAAAIATSSISSSARSSAAASC